MLPCLRWKADVHEALMLTREELAEEHRLRLQQQREEEAKMRRAVAKMRRGRLARAFGSLYALVYEKKRRRITVKQVLPVMLDCQYAVLQ